MDTQLSASAPAWSTRLMRELDANDLRARELTRGLTVEQLNWQPAPGAWSIGQCLEHLCIGTESYLPPISAALVNHPASPVQEITPGWFARWFIRSYIEPSPRTKRGSAPRKIVPSARVDASVVERFLRGNRETRELVRKSEPYDVNRIRFVNPFVSVPLHRRHRIRSACRPRTPPSVAGRTS